MRQELGSTKVFFFLSLFNQVCHIEPNLFYRSKVCVCVCSRFPQEKNVHVCEYVCCECAWCLSACSSPEILQANKGQQQIEMQFPKSQPLWFGWWPRTLHLKAPLQGKYTEYQIDILTTLCLPLVTHLSVVLVYFPLYLLLNSEDGIVRELGAQQVHIESFHFILLGVYRTHLASYARSISWCKSKFWMKSSCLFDPVCPFCWLTVSPLFLSYTLEDGDMIN